MNFENAVLRYVVKVAAEFPNPSNMENIRAARAFTNRLDFIRVYRCFGKIMDFKSPKILNKTKRIHFIIKFKPEAGDEFALISINAKNQFSLELIC